MGRGAAGSLGGLRGAPRFLILVVGGVFVVFVVVVVVVVVAGVAGVAGVGVAWVDDDPSMFEFCRIASLVVENLK